MRKAANVIFTYPGRDNVSVPVDEVFAWSDAQQGWWKPSTVVWEDGTSSYAKGWWFASNGKLQRVGAGAYGDVTILRRDDPDEAPASASETPKAELGSVSHGTLRNEDLLETFAELLETLAPGDEDAASLVAEAGKVDPDSEEASEVLSELQDALSELAPSYCYFGTHPGDASDFGFWLDEDFQQRMQEDEVLQVDDLADIPADYRGEVLHVNDHGNATFGYVDEEGNFVEVWSVV